MHDIAARAPRRALRCGHGHTRLLFDGHRGEPLQLWLPTGAAAGDSLYSLLGALKHWSLTPQQVKVVNLSPAQITAAWKRGDIDGAFTWSPALGEIRKTGKILTDAGQVSEWGAPTFEVWVARKDFADKQRSVIP